MGSVGAVISNPAELCWFVVSSVAELTDLIIRVVSCACKALKDGFTRCVIFLADCAVTWLTDGSHLADEIRSLREKIYSVTQSAHLSQLATCLTLRVLSGLEEHILQAKEIDPYFRPAWLKKMIGEDNESTLLGDLTTNALTQHRPLIQETIEINILTLFHRLVIHIQRLQRDQPLLIINFVKEALSQFSFTLQQLDGGEPRRANVRVRLLAKKLLATLFPRGQEDLILPFSHSFIGEFTAGNIREKIWAELSPKGAEDVLRDAFIELYQPALMNEILVAVLEKVKHLVNDAHGVEAEEEVNPNAVQGWQPEALQGLPIGSFNKVFSEATTALLDYIDPEQTLRGIRLLINHARIESNVTPKVVALLQKKTLLEFLNIACVELTPVLQRPITILKTSEEQNRGIHQKIAENGRTCQRLRKLADDVGKDSKGLLQLMNESPSKARSQGSSFSTLVDYLKKKGKEKGASFAAHQIRGIAGMAFEAYEPLMEQENVLLPDLASLAIKKLFSPRA